MAFTPTPLLPLMAPAQQDTSTHGHAEKLALQSSDSQLLGHLVSHGTIFHGFVNCVFNETFHHQNPSQQVSWTVHMLNKHILKQTEALSAICTSSGTSSGISLSLNNVYLAGLLFPCIFLCCTR